jgi:D-tyrosyl-tRNA(Tyr) deacylase
MRAVVQRVLSASVSVADECVARIEGGLLVLVGAEQGDTERDAEYLAEKVAGLRIFGDDDGRMNLSVQEAGGAILAVSQFTLLGDCRKGRRPSFVHAMEPDRAVVLFDHYVKKTESLGLAVHTGIFRTHMVVSLTNDGPVTLLIDSKKTF